jgi:hypothetical protein
MSALWLGNDPPKPDRLKINDILPLSPEQIRARVLALISVALIILSGGCNDSKPHAIRDWRDSQG